MEVSRQPADRIWLEEETKKKKSKSQEFLKCCKNWRAGAFLWIRHGPSEVSATQETSGCPLVRMNREKTSLEYERGDNAEVTALTKSQTKTGSC